MLAKEIMHRKVIKVAPDMTLREVAKVFIDRHISGAPVVNHEGQLIGVVSQTDLVVLVAHRKSLLEDFVLGTTAERILRHCRAPYRGFLGKIKA